MRRGIGWTGLSSGSRRTSRVLVDLSSSVFSRVPCGPVRTFLRTDLAVVFSKSRIPFPVICGHRELRVFAPSRRSYRSQTEGCLAPSWPRRDRNMGHNLKRKIRTA